MDEHIITIKDTWHHWTMRINLQELARDAGRKEKEDDGVYTDPRTGETERYKGAVYTVYPLTKAKKLLKLIRQFGTDKDFEACDKYLAQNAKLYKYWKELMG